MNRSFAFMLSTLTCTASVLGGAPSATAADYDYAEEIPEISLPGFDIAAARACVSSVKTTLTLTYRATTDTYAESIKATGRSTCSNDRLALGVTVTDESLAMPTYTKSAGGTALGLVTVTAAQTVPARLLSEVTFRWNFVPRYGPPQCLQKTYTVIKGLAPRAGDTKACGEFLEAPPEEA